MFTQSPSQLSDGVADIAEAHVLFREVNERIKSLHDPCDSLARGSEWICECADPGCVEHVEMSLADYDAIRAHPYRFAALPGHDLPHGGRVLERTSCYVIFERAEDGAA